MSSIHSVPIKGALSGIGAVYTDCFARRESDAEPVGRDRRRARPPFQRRFPLTRQGQAHLEDDIRREERCRERARIAHELHDTLLQGFLGASMLLHQAVEQTPADSASKPVLRRALRLVRRAIDEGRAAIRGLHVAPPAASSLEQAFSDLLSEITPDQGVRLRIFVQGKPQELNPPIQQQLFLIFREAVVNALRHSKATTIEVEIQYLRDLLRVFVRDNGCGIKAEAVQKESDSHWGLRGMRKRAEHIGARFEVWSKTGVGTEVCVAVPVEGAQLTTTHDCGP
jgi:signal transduction histidine kinase